MRGCIDAYLISLTNRRYYGLINKICFVKSLGLTPKRTVSDHSCIKIILRTCESKNFRKETRFHKQNDFTKKYQSSQAFGKPNKKLTTDGRAT